MSSTPEKNAQYPKAVIDRLEEAMRFGVYSGNSDNNTEQWSMGLWNILELKEGKVSAKRDTLFKYVDPEDIEGLKQIFAVNFKSRTDFETEFSLVLSDNFYKRVNLQNHFYGPEKKSYTGIVKDISEIHKYRHALEEKIRQLDKSNTNLQEFVYVASHDLQEPVRKIATFAGRIGARFGGQIGEEGNMYLSRLEKAVNNMQFLLDDLLNFSRLSFNDRPFEKIALSDTLATALGELDIKIEESSAKINACDLPVIEGYSLQLKQLFSNILSNAIKFRRPGVPPEINITAERVNPYAFPNIPLLRHTHYTKIEICDNGIGFEQEFSERIFKIFQRLNSKAEYGGSGVGLSICKKITENHNGHIFALSEPDKGSCFTILLPYAQS